MDQIRTMQNKIKLKQLNLMLQIVCPKGKYRWQTIKTKIKCIKTIAYIENLKITKKRKIFSLVDEGK